MEEVYCMRYDYNPCDICLDEKCGGTKSCNCKTCPHLKSCRKYLHPTIRITTRCTQSCSHCCFSCSPDKTRMMNIELAKEITKFLKTNQIFSLNVMGGEFYCNPNWYEILYEWLQIHCHIRLVSNGDWVTNTTVKNQLLNLSHTFQNQLHISISDDNYHTNQHVKDADAFLTLHNISHELGTDMQDTEETLMPLGNAEDVYNMYSFGVCYCHNPIHQYSFLIDETGDIYKCSFGVLQYDNIQNFTYGGFAKRFKEFNKKFYDIFMPSCKNCIRICEMKHAIASN